ncbi:hypothetical protein WOB75_04395 [Vibrio parahaemolyticus]
MKAPKKQRIKSSNFCPIVRRPEVRLPPPIIKTGKRKPKLRLLLTVHAILTAIPGYVGLYGLVKSPPEWLTLSYSYYVERFKHEPVQTEVIKPNKPKRQAQAQAQVVTPLMGINAKRL